MILVTGAAGKTGRAVIRALAEDREPVRALIHRPEPSASLKAIGARETCAGDMRSRAFVEQAVEGVRAIYHMAPNVSPDEVEIGHTVIEAARASGVERFVYHSVLHPHVQAMPHHWQKAGVEELIFASGLRFVILQPTVYMQNVSNQWEGIAGDGRYSIPYAAETRLCMVDLEDVAEAAAIALRSPDVLDSTVELVGTRPMSQTEVTEALRIQLGRPVTLEVESVEAWARNARASGMGDYQLEALVKMFHYYQDYGFVGNPGALTRLIGRRPTSFEEFVQRTIKERRNA